MLFSFIYQVQEKEAIRKNATFAKKKRHETTYIHSYPLLDRLHHP